MVFPQRSLSDDRREDPSMRFEQSARRDRRVSQHGRRVHAALSGITLTRPAAKLSGGGSVASSA
jgi:hypothetical protein